MSLLKKTRREFSWVGVASIGLLLMACSTDSPTAPEQVPAPFPSGGSGTVWTITLSVDPPSQTAGNDQPSTITIRVRRAGGGGAPADGTTAVVTTSLGEFASLGSGSQSAVVALINGLAQLLFFPGDVLGDALLTVRLEGSVGQKFVSIRALDTLFISALSPTTGPEVGGTRVRIEGTGFFEPLTVSLGDFPATVVSVGSKGLVIKIDTPQIFDAGAFFNTESCDADGDGEEDGERFLPTSVSLTVTLREGTPATASVENAFTYFPRSSACVEPVEPPEDPTIFILSVFPNNGPETGGTVVTITGRGFIGALRVFFQNKLATGVTSTNTTITATTPLGDLDTGPCDLGGGNTGTFRVDTPVQVKVELASGPSETLPNGFTYTVFGANPCI